ncbi:hypothetical protein [Rhodovulum sulfidophilum]|uniref:hypothetical protein n=1 Tax=Rhodovulum sulfidophilum TaxID=35806 RepID=UPI000952F491|nr:hypothetical protein [Rhodovulum sulfidophilum]MBL3554054.1 hypothetical protein [Rhodovulum sulfidophilum]OLS47699.1 hypothetical protein BV379_04940 [Rhodovulum sulfidophilum]
MTKSRFEIAFEGDPFDDGEIDVRDLAPTLLAFGNVVQQANRALNGDRADARLKVAATEKGSFVAALTVDVAWLIDMLDSVSAHPDRVVAADQLMDLLIKAGTIIGAPVGLFATLKKLKGKRPEKVEPKGDGTTEITINQTTFIVDDQTVDLLQDLPTREAIENLGQKARRVDGLERLRIGSDEPDHKAVRLERDDFPSLSVPPETDEPDVEVTRRDAWLKIVSVHFRDGYKWRFSDGGERPFTAEMEDTDFQNKVQEGYIAPNANDAIRCRLREEQSLSASNLSKIVYVEEVLEHRPGARQLNLL